MMTSPIEYQASIEKPTGRNRYGGDLLAKFYVYLPEGSLLADVRKEAVATAKVEIELHDEEEVVAGMDGYVLRIRKTDVEDWTFIGFLGCKSCESWGGEMGPGHFASPYCRSGRSNHCTCDTCF